MSRTALTVAAVVALGAAAAVVWYSSSQQHEPGSAWPADAIHATLETVVPAHNDLSFRYLLENRTDSDFRIANESDVRILGRSTAATGLPPELAPHVSGEFPLLLPARGKTHFALVWTSDAEIEPAQVSSAVQKLNLTSFVLVDNAHRFQIEFPLNPQP